MYIHKHEIIHAYGSEGLTPVMCMWAHGKTVTPTCFESYHTIQWPLTVVVGTIDATVGIIESFGLGTSTWTGLGKHHDNTDGLFESCLKLEFSMHY